MMSAFPLVRPHFVDPTQEPAMASATKATAFSLRHLSVAIGLLSLAACASPSSGGGKMSTTAPRTDPRVGLHAGVTDAGEAAWNLRLVSNTPSSEKFAGVTNSDLSFSGKYAIQGNYNGYQVWDISNPAKPSLTIGYLCPASQSDVSVYKNLLFVSGEGNSGRLDCGVQGVRDTVSHDRLRGIRIFDISDITQPKYIGNVQTCRGSHTHTVVVDPKDTENVYVYISGSAGVRSPSELPGCSKLAPDQDPNSSLFRIEVIKVPLAHPEQAAIVSSPRIFNDLTEPVVSRRSAGRHRQPGQGRRGSKEDRRVHGGDQRPRDRAAAFLRPVHARQRRQGTPGDRSGDGCRTAPHSGRRSLA